MSLADPVPSKQIKLLSWGVLWLTVAVVVGGALVRATDSGAGCGESWPICGGQLIPDIGNYHTAIEVSHRLMTGLLGFVLLALFVLVRRDFDKAHRLRRAVFAAGVLLIIESLLGASLVLFGWVEFDASIARLIVVPLHLVNTFLLVGAMTLVAFFASGGLGFRIDTGKRRDQLVLVGLGIVLLIGATGALNALADTLIQSDALAETVPGEVQVTEPVLRKIRTIHPFVSIIGGLALFMLVRYLAEGAGRTVRLLALGIQGIVWLQFFVGLLNIALEVPLETQLIHLFIADVLWIAVVLLGSHLIGGTTGARMGQSDKPVAEPV
ncbi:MAG: COX15/CtaA family protein [Acidimicrobiia bacterium]|nr:COX15/CtaA family protein [Acidimicrobiia bacterium]